MMCCLDAVMVMAKNTNTIIGWLNVGDGESRFGGRLSCEEVVSGSSIQYYIITICMRSY